MSLAGAPEPAPGRPDIVRLVAPNPGPMTLDGTNTYVVGRDPAWVVDPGPDDPGHLAAIGEAAGGEIAGVVLTHSHADHSAGVPALGAPLVWGVVSAGLEFTPADVSRPDPPPAELGPFRVIATPGHAPDHVALALGDVVLCGDLVLGRGSTIVPPAAFGGSLADYMRSLDALDGLGAALLGPGHGPWIADPAARIAEYRAHRLDRERRLLDALGRGERSRERLLAEVWDDVPQALIAAAALAMQAHVEKLEAEGRLDPAELTG